ncbi:MAG: helix-turn-helix transcriptional regulator [Alphaproteobacteria bacterium]
MSYENAKDLIRLSMLLQNYPKTGISLEDIQRETGKCRRQAERIRDALLDLYDLEDFWDETQNVKKWRLYQNSQIRNLPNQKLTPEHIASLETAIKTIERESLNNKAEHLREIRDWLENTVAKSKQPVSFKAELEDIMTAEGLALKPEPKEIISDKILQPLRQAILACQKVKIDYQSSITNKQSFTLICPYGFLYGARAYLIAYSKGDKSNNIASGYRLFRLSNISKVSITDSYFTRDENFDINQYTKKSFGVFHEDKTYNVVWKFNPKSAKEVENFVFHPTQKKIITEDGSTIIEFNACGLWEMCWHLFIWGNQVEILEPQELKDCYKEMIDKVAKNILKI